MILPSSPNRQMGNRKRIWRIAKAGGYLLWTDGWVNLALVDREVVFGERGKRTPSIAKPSKECSVP